MMMHGLQSLRHWFAFSELHYTHLHPTQVAMRSMMSLLTLERDEMVSVHKKKQLVGI